MSEPVSFLAMSGVVAVAALPLALKLVPPNRFYGFRTSKTLADAKLWIRVNRFAGFALLLSAAVSISVYLAHPELASGRSFEGLLVFAGPLVVVLGASVLYLRGITRDG